MFESVEAIFFDVGDTLYFSPQMEEEYPHQLLELIATTRNIDIAQADELLSEATRKLKGVVKHVTKVRAMAELGYSRAQVHEAFCKVDPYKYLSKDPELNSTIATLAGKYNLGIISNFRRSHLLEILDALGISANFFPLMVTEEIVKDIKPAPEPFLKAVELSGKLPHQCVYVADSPTKDIRPAKEIDMATILVARDPTSDDLKYADSTIENVKELVKLLPRTREP